MFGHRMFLCGVTCPPERNAHIVAGNLRERYRFDAEARELRFIVREPFISRSSTADLIYGAICEAESLEVVSQMAPGGVIFSGGMDADFLRFDSGMTGTVTVSPRRMNLVWPERIGSHLCV